MNTFRALQQHSMRRAGAFRSPSSTLPRAMFAPAQSRAFMQPASAAASNTSGSPQRSGEFDDPSLLSLLEASASANSPRRAQPDFDEPSLLSLLEASSVPNRSSLDSSEYIIVDDDATKQPVFKQVAGGKPKTNPIFQGAPVAEGDS